MRRWWLLFLSFGLVCCSFSLAGAANNSGGEAFGSEAGPEAGAETGAVAYGTSTSAAEQAAGDGAEGGLLAGARAGLRGSAYWLATNIDSWFGDRPFVEGGRAWGSLRLRGLYREDDGFNHDLRYRLRLRMPNLSERAYVFIGRDNEQELVRDEAEAFRRRRQLLPEDRGDDQTFFAGLGYFLRDNVDLRLGVRGTYRLYSQARYRRAWWVTEKSNLEFRQTLFLAVEEGLGATSSLDYARAINQRIALRWRNSATFSSETDGVAWNSGLGLFQAFSGQRELSLEALIHGETAAPVSIRQYGLRSVWRQPLYRDWLLGEVIVGHFWPRGDDSPKRQSSWAAGLELELQF